MRMIYSNFSMDSVLFKIPKMIITKMRILVQNVNNLSPGIK